MCCLGNPSFHRLGSGDSIDWLDRLVTGNSRRRCVLGEADNATIHDKEGPRTPLRQQIRSKCSDWLQVKGW